jgi:hypothetical protein
MFLGIWANKLPCRAYGAPFTLGSIFYENGAPMELKLISKSQSKDPIGKDVQNIVKTACLLWVDMLLCHLFLKNCDISEF